MKNAANIRLGRTSYDAYESAERSYTLDPDSEYDIDLSDIDPDELELHYGREFVRRMRIAPRRRPVFGSNVRNRREC